MNADTKSKILAGIAFAQVNAHTSSNNFGYWDKVRSDEEVVALIHRDISRALEIATIGDGPSTHLPDTSRLEESLADVIIRVLDMADEKKLSIGSALLYKLEFNERLSTIAKKDF